MARNISPKQHKPHVKKKKCRVHSVYDGDTITVKWEEPAWLGFSKSARLVKVRLAYIDTPELRYKEPGAVKAKDLLEKLVNRKRVILEYEQLPGGGPRKGDYNRMLAVIHLPRAFLPNVNINRLLLKKGLARLYKKPDNITPHHWKGLIRAERSAQRQHLGIWRGSRKWDQQLSSDIMVYVLIGIALGLLIGLILK